MDFVKSGKFACRIGASLAGLAWLFLPGAAAALGGPAVIQGVSAAAGGGATTVDIALTKPAAATLLEEDNRLVVMLPHTALNPALADHLTSAGLVAGIGVETPGDGSSERIILMLRAAADGTLRAGPDSQTVRVVITPAARTASPAPAREASLSAPHLRDAVADFDMSAMMRAEDGRQALTVPAVVVPAVAVPTVIVPRIAPLAAPPVRLYNVNAYQSDLAGILNSLGQDAHVSIVMAGPVSSKVTMTLRQVPLEKALDLLTKAAGLGYHQDGSAFVIGDAKDLAAAYPPPVPVIIQAVYHCLHVAAPDLVSTLGNTFDKDKLRVSLGAAPFSPRLDDATTSGVTGVQANTMKSSEGTTSGGNSHMIILAGEPDIVAQALDLAQKLDVRRAQVKIAVQITDIDRSALKNLGLQWSFGSLGFHESQPSGIGFGSFSRDPLSVSATITALENSGDAKLLAAPNMSLLDGERGFILIGDRLQYPKLIGYTQAQTPIYDVTEQRVGIYLQVAVQMEDNGEITLTIYPQVSTVSGYLNVNGASYPQISTREQQTTIRVKDGQQIVVGGLIRDEEIKNVQKVPILSSIPLFKELFTYRNTTRQQSEVVIVITPQILKD